MTITTAKKKKLMSSAAWRGEEEATEEFQGNNDWWFPCWGNYQVSVLWFFFLFLDDFQNGPSLAKSETRFTDNTVSRYHVLEVVRCFVFYVFNLIWKLCYFVFFGQNSFYFYFFIDSIGWLLIWMKPQFHEVWLYIWIFHDCRLMKL